MNVKGKAEGRVLETPSSGLLNSSVRWGTPKRFEVGERRSSLKTVIQKHACTPMFIAARFTITKTWKQSKCPSTEEWIKKMWYIYTMEYYSAIKNNEIMPFAATWMQLGIIILSEVNRKEKDN